MKRRRHKSDRDIKSKRNVRLITPPPVQIMGGVGEMSESIFQLKFSLRLNLWYTFDGGGGRFSV